MKSERNIDELIEKHYLGTLSKEEVVYLLNYLKGNEPNHELLTFYQKNWDREEDSDLEVDSDKIYSNILQRIGYQDSKIAPKSGSSSEYLKITWLVSAMRYAAVFIFAFGLSWMVHKNYNRKTIVTPVSSTDQMQTIEVPYGSKSRVFLPDGSVVNLNSGSSIKYSSLGFNNGSRSVFLTGEGFFNVIKDPDRPFYVNTPGLKLKVLGTTFNVKAYLDEKTEEAILVSGKVEIYMATDKTESGNPIVLKPNQRTVFSKSGNNLSIGETANEGELNIPLKLTINDIQSFSKTEETISWKDNKLIFNNEPFEQMVIKIERWYDVKILVNYHELEKVRITGKFDKESIEQVLNAIELITPFNYSIKQNLITISKK